MEAFGPTGQVGGLDYREGGVMRMLQSLFQKIWAVGACGGNKNAVFRGNW